MLTSDRKEQSIIKNGLIEKTTFQEEYIFDLEAKIKMKQSKEVKKNIVKTLSKSEQEELRKGKRENRAGRGSFKVTDVW